MPCSPATRLYGLIGSPVRHSLSPFIHCLVYRRHRVDAVYLAWETGLEELSERVRALRSLAWGFNVTIPLKEAVIKLLDEVEGEASVIGAVNTVARRGGRLVGYNTDYLGVMKCINRRGLGSVLVIGAGGAARAVVYALSRLGASRLVIANRSPGRAKRLASWASIQLGLDAEAVGLGEAGRAVERAEVVVNATPLGSRACCPDEAPPVTSSLHEGQLVFDLVYDPLETRLLREARRRGAETVSGLCMLIWQALYADKIWLGIEPGHSDYSYVEEKVLEKLMARGPTLPREGLG